MGLSIDTPKVSARPINDARYASAIAFALGIVLSLAAEGHLRNLREINRARSAKAFVVDERQGTG